MSNYKYLQEQIKARTGMFLTRGMPVKVVLHTEHAMSEEPGWVVGFTDDGCVKVSVERSYARTGRMTQKYHPTDVSLIEGE